MSNVNNNTKDPLLAELAESYTNGLATDAGFIWVPGAEYLIWDGRRWQMFGEGKNTGEVRAKRVIRERLLDLYREAQAQNNRDRADALHRLCSPRGYSEVLMEVTIARPELTLASDLDSNPYLFNTPDRVLDLSKLREGGEVQPLKHDGTLYLTKISGASYLGDGFDFAGTMWQKFLDFVQRDREVQRTMQQHVGLGLLGEVIEQRAVFHRNAVGKGAENGKSAYHLILRKMFGDYAFVAPESLFVGAKTNEFALAHVRGVRWLEVGELPESGPWNERLYKGLVAGDQQSAAFKHKGHFSFDPACCVSCHTNHAPRLRGGDPGTERRTVCVLWERSITSKQKPKVRSLVDHILDKELDAVLTWAVEGLRDYYQSGKNLYMPDTVQQASFDLAHENDPVTEWLAEETERDPDAVVYVSDLRDRYNMWAQRNGRAELTAVAFSGFLNTNQIEVAKAGNRGQRRSGVRLTP